MNIDLFFKWQPSNLLSVLSVATCHMGSAHVAHSHLINT